MSLNDIEDEDLKLSSLDPLKVARRDKLLREIRNEDLKLAVAEGQFMLVETHRQELSDIIGQVITSLDTLPDVLERKLALDGHIVDALRKSVDDMRDNLYIKLMELQGEDVVPAKAPAKSTPPAEPPVPDWMAPPTKPTVPDWMLPQATVVEKIRAATPATGSKPKLRGRPSNAERVARMGAANG